MGTNNPFVSCVMPTWNRRAFIPGAVDCFLKQTYKNCELVILDDGEEPIEDLIPKNDRIRYVFENHRRITGDKRNQVNELARGEIICHWDDDDWSGPDRIVDQVSRLQKSGKPVTGYATLYFWHIPRQETLIFISPNTGYVCGTTLCYYKDFWKQRLFRHRHEATDNDFVYPIIDKIAPYRDSRHMVARIHNCHHTSRKNGIQQKVPREKIPAAFWENEKLRLKTE